MIARLQIVAPPLAKHAFGSVQLSLRPKTTQAEILRAMQAVIDKRDLRGKGVEAEHHVTIRYGITNNEIAALKAYLTTVEAFSIEFGETKAFPPAVYTDGAAVIYVEVFSPELEVLNKELPKHASFKEADYDYHPHMTLAYVDPDSVQKYINWPNLSGFKYEVSEVEICSKDDDSPHEVITLRKPSGMVTYFGKLLVYIPKKNKIQKFGELVGRIE